jgi:hypothetical protein
MLPLGWADLSPDRGWSAHTLLKLPRWAFEPFTNWDRTRPIPIEDMMSIQPLHLTAAASREIRVQPLTSRRSR